MASLQNLKKTTVREVIRLADLCPNDENFTPEEIQAGLRGQFSVDSPSRYFNAFLQDLTAGELAELTALCWLGRDMLAAVDWDEIVARAYKAGNQELVAIPKRKLPPYLRSGMERLARVKANKVIPRHHEGEARKQLIGEFVLQTYQNNYGHEQGLQRLVLLMEEKGFLNDPQRRTLFGLSEEPMVDPLDESLRTTKPGVIKVGEIRNS